MGRFIVKRELRRPVSKYIYNNGRQSNMGAARIKLETPAPEEKVIEKKKEKEIMDTKEKVALASAILENEGPKPRVKRVKKDMGLIERVDTPKIVLTEDNKELLND